MKVEVLSVQAYIWCPSYCSAGIEDAVNSTIDLNLASYSVDR